jgi:hypothetical protein
MKWKINWDALGISASLACAIHCAVLPLILQSLPLFGYNIIDNSFFEMVMICIAAAIGLYSLYHGWRKHHHKVWPIIILFLGLVFLLLKQVWHDQQLWFLIPAVILIVSAHYLNYRYCKKANHCHAADCEH